jgi:hypothetical protein
MKMNRREFGQASLFGILTLWFTNLLASFWMYACSAADIWTKIKTYLPTVVTAIGNVLAMLSAIGIIPIGTGTAAQALIDLITGLVKSVVATIDEYLAADPATKATLLGKIRDALQAISDNITGFISGLNLSGNPIVKVVGLLIGLIVSTISGFLNVIPVPAGTSKHMLKATSIRVDGQTFPVVPKVRDKASFIYEWNAACVANGHPEAGLPVK